MKAENKMKIEKLDSLMTKEFPAQEWLVDKFIPQDGLVMLSAAPSSYKTFLALEIAKSVAGGKQFLNRFDAKQAGVLIIDEESGDRILKERFEQLQTCQDLPIYYRSREYDRMTDAFHSEIVSTCKENNIGLVIFDSFIRLLPAGTDENVSTSVAQVLESFNRVADNNIACLVIHHNKKGNKTDPDNFGDSMRGSGDIRAACDIHISLTRDEDILTITQTKNRYCKEIRPIRVELRSSDDGETNQFCFLGYDKSREDWYQDFKQNVYQYIFEKPGQNITQTVDSYVEDNPSASKEKVRSAIKKLLKDGWIYAETGKHNGQKLYVKEDDGHEKKEYYL